MFAMQTIERDRSLARRAAVALALAALASLALATAGCGSGSSGSGVAQAPTTSSETQPSQSGKSQDGGSTPGNAAAYSACMRRNGVPKFPDPDASGTIHASIPRNSPKFKAADRTCQHLLPQPSPQEQATYLQDALAYAKCMRGHGAPTFPDPYKAPDGGPEFPEIGVNQSSPQFKAAQRACHELLPGSP
jgi:hypothetical protein